MCGHLALAHVAVVSPIRSVSVLEGKEGGGALFTGVGIIIDMRQRNGLETQAEAPIICHAALYFGTRQLC